MTKICNILILFFCLNSLVGQNLVSLSPDQGSQGQTLGVTISGQNTHFSQASMTSFWFSQGSSTLIFPTYTGVLSATQLQATFTFTYNNLPGYYQANQYNDVDGLLVLPNAFLLNPGTNPPALLAVNPGTGMQGQTLNVSLTGQNTHFLQGTNTTYWFSQGTSTLIYPTSSAGISQTEIQAQFTFNYTHPTGYYQANQFNSVDGLLTKPNAFLLSPGGNPPAIVSVTPSAGMRGDIMNVTISGQNTHFQQASISFNQNGFIFYPQTSQVISNTLIQASFFISYMYPLGLYNTTVQTVLDGLMSLNNSFTVLQNLYFPSLLPGNPDTLGGINNNLTIHGSHTHFLSAGNTVVTLLGQYAINNYLLTILNDSVMTAYFSIAGVPSGYYSVKVTNAYDLTLYLPYQIYINNLPIGTVETRGPSFSCYPNPFTNEMYLSHPSAEKIEQIRCFDLTGRELFKQLPDHLSSPMRLAIDHIIPGVYYLEVIAGGKASVIKILKQ